jgi:hypothetical protein
VNDLWSGTPKKQDPTSSSPPPSFFASTFASQAIPQSGTEAFKEFQELKLAIDGVIDRNIDAIVATAVNINSTPSTASIDDLGKQILGYLDSDDSFQSSLSAALQSAAFRNWVTTYYYPSETAYTKAVSKFEADVDNLSKGWHGFNGDFTFGQQYPTTTSAAATSSSSNSTNISKSSLLPAYSETSTATSAGHIPDYLVSGIDLSWQPLSKTSSDGSNALPPPAGIPGVTINLKSSFYTNPDAALNEKTFRGAQGGLQMQWNLGKKSPFVRDPNDKSQLTLSANGSYQRLQENRDQMGKRPDIALGSLKLTIPFPSGVSFPLAVTIANSQEQQAKGTYTVGNFGITFDVDKLAALLGAGKQ